MEAIGNGLLPYIDELSKDLNAWMQSFDSKDISEFFYGIAHTIAEWADESVPFLKKVAAAVLDVVAEFQSFYGWIQENAPNLRKLIIGDMLGGVMDFVDKIPGAFKAVQHSFAKANAKAQFIIGGMSEAEAEKQAESVVEGGMLGKGGPPTTAGGIAAAATHQRAAELRASAGPGEGQWSLVAEVERAGKNAAQAKGRQSLTEEGRAAEAKLLEAQQQAVEAYNQRVRAMDPEAYDARHKLEEEVEEKYIEGYTAVAHIQDGMHAWAEKAVEMRQREVQSLEANLKATDRGTLAWNEALVELEKAQQSLHHASAVWEQTLPPVKDKDIFAGIQEAYSAIKHRAAQGQASGAERAFLDEIEKRFGPEVLPDERAQALALPILQKAFQSIGGTEAQIAQDWKVAMLQKQTEVPKSTFTGAADYAKNLQLSVLNNEADRMTRALKIAYAPLIEIEQKKLDEYNKLTNKIIESLGMGQ
jgi:hypothetical protein